MATDKATVLDAAIAKAKARQAAKAGNTAGDATAAPSTKEPKEQKPKATDEEKEAKKAAKNAVRAATKELRDAARAEKRAAKDAARKTPHMSKVEKAALKLPTLSENAQIAMSDITSNYPANVVAAIAAHLMHFNRVQSTARALAGSPVKAGDRVRIVSGDTRFTGCEATVFKAQRIRCYVTVEGAAKPVYLFMSNVELAEAATELASATG